MGGKATAPLQRLRSRSFDIGHSFGDHCILGGKATARLFGRGDISGDHLMLGERLRPTSHFIFAIFVGIMYYSVERLRPLAT